MSRRGTKKGRPASGWLVFDKPHGMGSTEAVSKIKWLYGAEKAGHAGTLDPLASGMLPIALGEATKTVPYVQDGAARFTSFAVQAILVLRTARRVTWPGRTMPYVATAGILDQTSLVLLGLGALTNSYGIVTVLLGLYPVVTVLLGTILLGERLTRVQSVGATLALAGVMLVSV